MAFGVKDAELNGDGSYAKLKAFMRDTTAVNIGLMQPPGAKAAPKIVGKLVACQEDLIKLLKQ